jgi:tetratricopeptide (TPR) repeat protein
MSNTLRTVFSAGPSSGLSAQDTFTNRVDEMTAFWDSVDSMATRTAALHQAVTDPTRPRENILVYYGNGGIGKTALSRELRQRVDREAGRYASHSFSTVHVDFAGTSPFHLETVVLALRASLWKLKPRWDAFDLLFALYWERTHPGLPLSDFTRHESNIKKVLGKFNIGDQATDAAEAMLDAVTGISSIASTVRRSGMTLFEAIRVSHVTRTLKAQCPFFAPLLEEEASDEALSYMPSLLAWELSNMPDDHQALPMVFLDTFESLTRPGLEYAERLVNRIVFLMPNVLFVITGRDRLDWASPSLRCVLDYRGPSRWPGLGDAATEPRQHRVGYLSRRDSERYLCSIRTVATDEPAIPPEIRARIIEESSGFPLYLDLSVALFLDLVGRGRIPLADDFGGPLPAVIGRVMRHLSEDERAVLRGASLLDGFDRNLARAGAGDVADHAVARFLTRSIVEHDPTRAIPYRLHSSLRKAITEADDELLEDGWSDHEWAQSATRLLEALHQLITAPPTTETYSFAISQALQLVVRLPKLPVWLVMACEEAAEKGAWSALGAPCDKPAPGPAAFCYGVTGIAMRRQGTLPDAVSRMQSALRFDMDPLPHDLLATHCAHAMRNSGDYSGAEVEYRHLARAQGAFAEQARFQLADLQYLRSRFAAAKGDLQIPRAPSYLAGEEYRLAGHIDRAQARFQEAAEAYETALGIAEIIRSDSLRAKALTNLVETYCWLAPDRAAAVLPEALERNASLGNKLELIKVHAADAVAKAALGCTDLVGRRVGRALTLVEACGYEAAHFFAWAPRALQAALDRDFGVLDETIDDAGRLAARLGVYGFWPTIFLLWRTLLSDDAVPTFRRGTTNDELQSFQGWSAPLEIRL